MRNIPGDFVFFFEVRDDVVVVIERHVAVDHHRNPSLSGNFFDFVPLGMRPRNVDVFVIEQEIRQLRTHARTIRTPLGLVENDICLLSHTRRFASGTPGSAASRNRNPNVSDYPTTRRSVPLLGAGWFWRRESDDIIDDTRTS
jgi:hypothetical protein